MRGSRVKLSVSPIILVWLALLLLLLPVHWIAAWILAAVLHELGHVSAIKALRIPIEELSIGLNGARIRTGCMHPWQELLSTLAGPLVGILTLLTASLFPRLALCAALQSMYNLMPVYPLDGGRALRCGARLLLSETAANRLCAVLEWCCLTGIVLLGGYAVFVLRLGLLPGILAVSLVIRSMERKIPCKQMKQALQ